MKPTEGGGMPAESIPVRWEVATDDSMRSIVQSGDAIATPQLAHSVHVEVEGLQPDRWYWYRFRSGDAVSPIGRTRTMPERTSLPEKFRFVFASCQHFETGLYTAYEHMAQEEFDLLVHLGDYIYESGGRPNNAPPGRGGRVKVRTHIGKKLSSLADYRNRYAQYRSDPHLQRMHARCPWVVTWDDHEVEDNYADRYSWRSRLDPVQFLEVRANAYQAYYEMMPLRKRSLPRGPNLDLYRTINFGRLAAFQVLDTRQYRTKQVNGNKMSPLNADAINPQNTIMGFKQARWLENSLLQSTATWNVLAQQIMFAMLGEGAGDKKVYGMEDWTGYTHERIDLVKFIAERNVPNTVVLTGDMHSSWVNDIRVDDRKIEEPIVATEFVGTSISSAGDGSDKADQDATIFSENPCVRFSNRQRGYVGCTLTPQSWRSDYRVLPFVSKPGAPISTRASFVIEAGKPGVKPA